MSAFLKSGVKKIYGSNLHHSISTHPHDYDFSIKEHKMLITGETHAPTEAPTEAPAPVSESPLLSDFSSGASSVVLAAGPSELKKCGFPKAVDKKAWKTEYYSTEDSRPIKVLHSALLAQPSTGAIVMFHVESDTHLDATLSGVSLRVKVTSRRIETGRKQEKVFEVSKVNLALGENVKALGDFPAGHLVHSICSSCPATNVFVAAAPLVEKIVSNPFEHVEKMRAEFSITSAEKKVLVGCSKPVFRMA